MLVLTIGGITSQLLLFRAGLVSELMLYGTLVVFNWCRQPRRRHRLFSTGVWARPPGLPHPLTLVEINQRINMQVNELI